MSADDIAEKLFQRLSASRRRAFAPSKDDDKAGDDLWEAYLDAVEDEDKASTESWNGSTTGILTFTGLFAATVAAFVIESYQMLQPDPGAQATALGNQNTALLVQIVQILSANQTTPVVALPDLQPAPFEAPQAAVIVNTLWFLSLVISLICALLATLIQEWTRDFLRDIQRRTPDMTIKEYAYNHIYVRMGVEHFKLDYVTSLIVALMHIAVILFLIGLVMFLFPIHHTPAIVVEAFGIVAAAVYAVFSAMPLWDNSCPYRTPLTYALAAVRWSGVSILFAIMFPALNIIAVIVDSVNGVWFWKSASTEDLARLLGFVRYSFYAWVPIRRLPGHKIPAHISGAHILLFTPPDKESEEKYFVDNKRLLFLWGRASEYLLSPEGAHVLLVHLQERILAFDFHDYGAFFVYLQQNPAIIARIAERMTSVQSLEEGLQALQLLRLLIIAGRFTSFKDYAEGERWNNMSGVIPHLPSIAQAIVSTTKAASTQVRIAVLVTLSELRQTVIVLRVQIARDLMAKDFERSIASVFLNKMLLALDEIRGFSMLKLYSDTTRRMTGWTGVRDMSWHYELAVQNTLTLILNVMRMGGSALDSDAFGTIMETWRTLSTEEDFAAFSETSRGRQPSAEIKALFLSGQHGYYACMLTPFADLFTLPNRVPLQHDSSELIEAYQILYDSSELIEAYQTLENIELLFSLKRESDGSITSPGRIDTGDHATVGTAATSTTSLVIAAALRVPLPPSPSDSHDGETSRSSRTLPSSIRDDERLPDSPSLRSAEEGTFDAVDSGPA